MPRIAVVTDSTADLPPDLAEAQGLRVVPMSVTFGGATHISRITITDEEFYAQLAASSVLPTTSQPAPRWFEEAYLDALDEGCEGVVSIHLSGKLSGTVEQARRLAAAAPIDVRVVETGHVAGALALVVLAAGRVAAQGGSMDEVIRASDVAGAAVGSWILVDSLDYLRRGGRLTGAQAMMGNVLRVKPILTVRDGVVEVVERTRTSQRGIEAMARMAAEHLDGRPGRVVVSHAMAPERADAVWAALEAVEVELAERLVTPIGPVLGTHAGPGTVSIAVLPAT